MEKAKNLDTGALSEAGTDLIDIPVYLKRLRQLTEEALPEKRKRFLDYLNQSSDQGVTQLLTSIREQVSKIEERISDLNRILHDVDFKDDRYLRLDLQPVLYDSLRSLEQAQKQLRSAALRTDDDRGEAHSFSFSATLPKRNIPSAPARCSTPVSGSSFTVPKSSGRPTGLSIGSKDPKAAPAGKRRSSPATS